MEKSFFGGNKFSLRLFIRQVFQEGQKVFWPSSLDTIKASGVVFFLVFCISIFVFLLDQGISLAIKFILEMGV